MGIKENKKRPAKLNVYKILGEAKHLAETALCDGIGGMILIENIQRKIPVLLTQFRKADGSPLWTGDEIAAIASEGDPTPNAEYITWILKLIQKNDLRWPEDAPDLKDALTHFHRLKKSQKVQVGTEEKMVNGTMKTVPKIVPVTLERDIMKYKSRHDLFRAIRPYKEVQTVRQTKKAAAIAGLTYLGEHPSRQWCYFKVTTPEAAEVVGKTSEWRFTEEDEEPTPLVTNKDATQWCTRDPSLSYVRTYLKDGPLWVIERRAKPSDNYSPYAQMHFPTKQFMNVEDRAIGEAHKFAFMKLLEKWTGVKISDDPDMVWNYTFVLNPPPEDQRDGETEDEYWERLERHYDEHHKRYPEGEPTLLEKGQINMLTEYANIAFRGRWPEAEPRILKDKTEREVYADQIVRRNAERAIWPELEAILLKEASGKSDESAAAEPVEYINGCRRAKWPEMEAALSGAALTKYMTETAKYSSKPARRPRAARAEAPAA